MITHTEKARLERELRSITGTVTRLATRVADIAAVLDEQPSDDLLVVEKAAEGEAVVSFDYEPERTKGPSIKRRVVSVYEIETDSTGNRLKSFLGYDHGRNGIRRYCAERITTTIAVEPQIAYRQPA